MRKNIAIMSTIMVYHIKNQDTKEKTTIFTSQETLEQIFKKLTLIIMHRYQN